MRLFLLKSERGYYKSRNQWVDDPQKASVWTNKQGPSAVKGSCYPQPTQMEIVEFVGVLPAEK